MWNKNRLKDCSIEDLNQGQIVQMPEKMVSCKTCKCLLYKSDAHKVESNYNLTLYYCESHRKPYSYIKFDASDPRYFLDYGRYNINFPDITRKYFAELEVNEDGTPVGYKKIK